ncbi:MAG TPA: DUF4142 domain-containing protein [Armatimonadota bacterium]|jgi:putative membrane protein
MNTRFLLAACICASVAASSTAAAKMKDMRSMRGAGGAASSADRAFLRKAAQGGMTEVTLGKLAAERGSSQVKEFGQRMVRDHSKANADLKSVASKLSIRLPSDLGPEGSTMKAKLSRLHGAAFDSAYVKGMVGDHRADVAEFSKAAGKARNPDVKAFASRTLPVIQDHLKMIEGLEGSRSRMGHGKGMMKGKMKGMKM